MYTISNKFFLMSPFYEFQIVFHAIKITFVRYFGWQANERRAVGGKRIADVPPSGIRSVYVRKSLVATTQLIAQCSRHIYLLDICALITFKHI